MKSVKANQAKPSYILATTKLSPVKEGCMWTERENGKTVRFCAISAIAQEFFPHAYMDGSILYVNGENIGSARSVLNESGILPYEISARASDIFVSEVVEKAKNPYKKVVDFLQDHGY